MYELNDPPKNLYRVMEKSLRKGALMGCAIEVPTALAQQPYVSQVILS